MGLYAIRNYKENLLNIVYIIIIIIIIIIPDREMVHTISLR